MKFILALALFGAVLADKDYMLQKNRIPFEATSVGSTCDECQSLVKRFVDAAHDEQKMRELKMLLNVLCHETSYVDECRVFVNNLDKLVKKLEPYLKDTHRVCKAIHLCGNNRLDAFRRIGMLYVKRTMNKVDGMKDLVCDECQLAANELKHLVDDKEKQQEIRDFFSKQVCIHAGSYRGMCDMLVEQFLPELFQELDVILKDTKKACADLGFCPRVSSPARLQVLPSAEHPILAFFREAKSVKTSQGSQVLMSCIECKITVDGLLEEALNEKNLLAKDFQDLVCLHVLPANFTPSCEDFMSMYLPTVIYMTIKQFDAQDLCTNTLHSCDTSSISALATVPKREQKQLATEACPTLQAFLKENVANAHMRVNAIAMAQDTFCEPLPSVLQPLCYSSVERIVPTMLNRLATVSAEGRFCSKQ